MFLHELTCEDAVDGRLSIRRKAGEPEQPQRHAVGLAFTAFFDVRGGQAKSPAVDLVGHDALMHGFSERLIQPLQKRRDALIVTAHECGEQSLVVYGDGCAFDRRDSSQHDVSAGTGEQRCDVRPAIIRAYIPHMSATITREFLSADQARNARSGTPSRSRV
jgi:hypothetical protein